MMESMYKIMSQFSSGRKYRSNILSPLLWLNAVVFPCCFYGVFKIEGNVIKTFCGFLIIGLLLYDIIKYEYWQKNDPDRLHSEWFLAEKIKAEMAIQGGKPKLINEDEIITPSERQIDDLSEDK